MIIRDVSFAAALGLVLVTLKLTGAISWSWWLVLLPLYIGFVALMVIGLIIWVVAHFVATRKKD